MTGARERLDVGWQSRPPAIALAFSVGVFGALVAASALGPLPGLTVALFVAVAALGRMQWASLDGCALLLRETRTRYADRAWPARQFGALRFRRSWLPWCRLGLERQGATLVLVVSGPSPRHAQLRSLTMWMIVHGRRRARIDPRLLDALAAMPEHGRARQPHDASPA